MEEDLHKSTKRKIRRTSSRVWWIIFMIVFISILSLISSIRSSSSSSSSSTSSSSWSWSRSYVSNKNQIVLAEFQSHNESHTIIDQNTVDSVTSNTSSNVNTTAVSIITSVTTTTTAIDVPIVKSSSSLDMNSIDNSINSVDDPDDPTNTIIHTTKIQKDELELVPVINPTTTTTNSSRSFIDEDNKNKNVATDVDRIKITSKSSIRSFVNGSSTIIQQIEPHLTAKILPLPTWWWSKSSTTPTSDGGENSDDENGHCNEEIVKRIYGIDEDRTYDDATTTVSSSTSNHNNDKESTTTKFMLFITTHWSREHIRFFDCCWSQLMDQSTFLQRAHIVIAATNSTPVRVFDDDYGHVPVSSGKQQQQPQQQSQPFSNFRVPTSSTFMYHLQHVVFGRNPSFEMKWIDPKQHPQNRHTSGSGSVGGTANFKQWGANLGLQIGFQQGWFTSSPSSSSSSSSSTSSSLGPSKSYDWIIRVNPDVLIRNSTMLQRYFDDPTVDVIVHNCRLPSCNQFPYLQLHTDIIVFRPNAPLLWQQPRPKSQQQGHERKVVDANKNNTAINNNIDVDIDIPFSQMERGIGDDDGHNLNHELTASKYFHTIIRAGRHRWWDGLPPSHGLCRVGAGASKSSSSPVIHDHSIIDQCRIGYNHSSPIQRACNALDGYPIV